MRCFPENFCRYSPIMTPQTPNHTLLKSLYIWHFFACYLVNTNWRKKKTDGHSNDRGFGWLSQ
ncbi:unnamed protein product [Larinioides sclopetarius]|uniref:Uncharacterized protein n=1 Tax=Larinioides sclopetarius TaxID=280406 RepID=A0AAV2AWU0_9ARAC